ncbi:MAG: PAS domain S-box protein [Bacteroidetes bacterium]|nr:PAS domain S-box protein [Bacteroidota bacterium]
MIGFLKQTKPGKTIDQFPWPLVHIINDVVYINSSFEKLLGYKQDEVKNTNQLFALLYREKAALLSRNLLSDHNDDRCNTFVAQTNTKTGQVIDTELSIAPSKKGTLIAFRDVSKTKKSEELLRQLSRSVEQSPVSVIITDTSGLIEYVNPKFVQITGYTFEEVKGKNPRVLNSGDKNPDEYKELWDTILAGNEWRGEFHNKKKNGELFWEFASISPLKNNDGEITHLLGVKEDITRRKNAEKALAESENGFRQLAETANDGIIGLDGNLKVVYWNSAAEKAFGYNKAEAIGMDLESVIPKKYRENYLKLLSKREHPIRQLIGKTIEVKGVTKEGRPFPIEVSWNTWTQWGDTMFCVIIRDIEERKKAEQELANLNRELLEDSKQLLKIQTKAFVSGQEREKERVAKDLHDGLGQVLSSVKRNFISFCESVKQNDIQWDLAELVEKLLLSSISESRRISSGLLPSVLRDFGWLEAIEDLSNQFTDISISMDIDPNVRKKNIPDENQVHIYRIFQEALTNSSIHSRCKNIDIQIKEAAEKLLIQIDDDGVGFPNDPKGQKKRMEGGHGIFNMLERVNLLGGVMDIDSSVGKGTHISIKIPAPKIK